MTSIIYDYADINSRLPPEHRSVEKPKAEKKVVFDIEALPSKTWRALLQKQLVTDDDEDPIF